MINGRNDNIIDYSNFDEVSKFCLLSQEFFVQMHLLFFAFPDANFN